MTKSNQAFSHRIITSRPQHSTDADACDIEAVKNFDANFTN